RLEQLDELRAVDDEQSRVVDDSDIERVVFRVEQRVFAEAVTRVEMTDHLFLAVLKPDRPAQPARCDDVDIRARLPRSPNIVARRVSAARDAGGEAVEVVLGQSLAQANVSEKIHEIGDGHLCQARWAWRCLSSFSRNMFRCRRRW